MKILFCALCLISFIAIPVFGQVEANTSYKSKAIKFLPNRGQIADKSYKPRPDVLFHVEGKGIYLKDNGITYVMVDSTDAIKKMVERLEVERDMDLSLDNNGIFSLGVELTKEISISTHQISMVFKGMNAGFNVKKSSKSMDYLNYYMEQCPDGVEKVYSYLEITYQNAYDGIDIQFFGNETGDLKYDYIIAPYADPSQIKLEWLGADSVFINEKGELVVDNQVKAFKESLPKVYQLLDKDTLLIEAQYKLEHLAGHYYVSFDLGNYDPENSLIIDPWITNYGGENPDGARNVSTDKLGNVLVTGYTFSTLEIAEDGYLEVFGGVIDGFVAKLNPLGDRLWGTYYGSSNNDDMVSSAADSDNNVICVGYTESNTGIAFDGYQMTKMGISDGFMVKFDPAGIRIWSTYYGGEATDLFFDVRVSSNDDIYAVGYSSSLSGVASPGAFQTVYAGGQDLFLAKFNSDGDRIWATYCGGEDNEYGGGMGLEPDGTAYIAGTTRSITGIATAEAHQDTYAANRDAFLVKFDPAGNRVWGTYFGTEYQESGADAITDTLGNVYLCGDTYSETGMSFAGNQMTNAGPGDDDDSYFAREAYLAQFDEAGVLIWATYVGGSNEDYGYSVVVDEETNNVIYTGDTYSSDYPTTGCAVQPSINPAYGENAFIAQFEVDGALYCASYFGKDHEEATTVAIFDCYLYLSGSTPSNIATPGVHQNFFGGGPNDAFIAQLYKYSCSLDLPDFTLVSSQTDVTNCIICDGTATVSVLSEDNCFDDKTITYRWSNGEEFLNSTETSSTVTDVCATDDFWVEVELGCGFFDTLFFDFTGGAGFPEADFSATNVCLGETVNFNNLSTGTIISYEWDFGDGSTSDLENPSHAYSDLGTYLVTLTIENEEGCIHVQSYEIIIFPSFSVDVYSLVCYDSLYTFPDGVQTQITEDLEEVTYLETIGGCDSVITTHITILDGYIQYDTVYTSYNSSVLFPDGETQLITEKTEHISVFESGALCDSIIHTAVLITVFDFLPPNIFTPEGDSKNDLFYFPSEGIASFECVIVNRWGIQVFKFNSITDKWDGVNSSNGKECVSGVYFYTYSGVFIQGDTFEGQGSLQLIR